MQSLRGGPNPSARLDETRTPVQALEGGGVFCRETMDLGAGPHTLRIQLLLPRRAGPQALEVTARLGETSLAKAVIDTARADALQRADELTLSFHLEQPGRVEIEGVASAFAPLTHLRCLTQAPVERYEGNEARFRFFEGFDLESLVPRTVVFGTTAVCNANCFHCPTNKAYSKTQAKGFMDMALFERIVDELADMDFSGGVVFGLFGEPLSDPLFLERMRHIRRKLPKAILSPATNGAVYDPARHAEALSYADDVVVHIEGVSEAVYNASMRPLKLDRTRLRVQRMIEDRAGKPLRVVSPVHRRNLHEMVALRDEWEQRGTGATLWTYLMNRAGQADAFDDVALAPTATACSPSILEDLVIDWDGAVITCCQDFHRRTIIGDLTKETVREVLTNVGRRRMADLLNDKRWNAIETCAGCKTDCEASIAALMSERVKDSDARRMFSPREFRTEGEADARPDRIVVRARRPLSRQIRHPLGRGRSATIFGPYKPLHPGTYTLALDLAHVRTELRGRVILDIEAPSGVLASRRLKGHDLKRAVTLTFETRNYTPLEFRLRAKGVDFTFLGASTTRVEAERPLAS